jgi:hypothetical protein
MKTPIKIVQKKTSLVIKKMAQILIIIIRNLLWTQQDHKRAKLIIKKLIMKKIHIQKGYRI